MNKSIPLIFILVLTASSIIMVQPTLAQSTPSVPEFTVKLVAHPYDYPATYSIDQYTGKNVTIQEGGRAENRSIEITIKNQPVASKYCVYYNVRVKGHFGSSWTELYSYSVYSSGSLRPQSNSGYTVLSISPDYYGEVDFQVQAVLGYYAQVFESSMSGSGTYEEHFIGETSGWSNTQTLTISDAAPSATASPTITPTPSPTSTPSPSPTPTNTLTPTPITTPSPSQTNNQGVSKAEFYTTIAVFAAVIVALIITVVMLVIRAEKTKKDNQ